MTDRFDDNKPQTVADLIEQLHELDPTLLVYTEGCDCVGPWSGDVTVVGSAAINAYYRPAHVCIGRNDDRNVVKP
jgi:hypothetical protein